MLLWTEPHDTLNVFHLPYLPTIMQFMDWSKRIWLSKRTNFQQIDNIFTESDSNMNKQQWKYAHHDKWPKSKISTQPNFDKRTSRMANKPHDMIVRIVNDNEKWYNCGQVWPIFWLVIFKFKHICIIYLLRMNRTVISSRHLNDNPWHNYIGAASARYKHLRDGVAVHIW